MARIHALCFTTPAPWSARAIADLLDSRGVFACVETGGFLLGRIAGPEAEVLTLAVDPDFRRQGIALRLMQAFETTALSHESLDLFLEVAEGNDSALKLYQRCGFTQTGIRKDYYATPRGLRRSALVLTKPVKRI